MKRNVEDIGKTLKAQMELLEEVESYRAVETVDKCRIAVNKYEKSQKIWNVNTRYNTHWLCPECKAEQIKVDFQKEDGSISEDMYSFCWKCGQRLDWRLE